MLIEAGAIIDNRDLDSGATPLYIAAQDGNVEAAKMLQVVTAAGES